MVEGPIEIVKRIYKGSSLNTTLSGIFLDEMEVVKKIPENFVENKQIEKSYNDFYKRIDEGNVLQFNFIKDIKYFDDELEKEINKGKDKSELLWMKLQVHKWLMEHNELEETFNQYLDEIVKKKGFEQTIKEIFPQDRQRFNIEKLKESFLYQQGLVYLYKKYQPYKISAEKIIELASNSYELLYDKYLHPHYSINLLKEAMNIYKDNEDKELLQTLRRVLRQVNEIGLKGEVIKEIKGIYGSKELTDEEEFQLVQAMQGTEHGAYIQIIQEYENVIKKYPKSIYAEKAYMEEANFVSSRGKMTDSVSIYNEYLEKFPNGELKDEMEKKLNHLIDILDKIKKNKERKN